MFNLQNRVKCLEEGHLKGNVTNGEFWFAENMEDDIVRFWLHFQVKCPRCGRTIDKRTPTLEGETLYKSFREFAENLNFTINEGYYLNHWRKEDVKNTEENKTTE